LNGVSLGWSNTGGMHAYRSSIIRPRMHLCSIAQAACGSILAVPVPYHHSLACHWTRPHMNTLQCYKKQELTDQRCSLQPTSCCTGHPGHVSTLCGAAAVTRPQVCHVGNITSKTQPSSDAALQHDATHWLHTSTQWHTRMLALGFMSDRPS